MSTDNTSNFEDVGACYQKYGMAYDGPPRELDVKTSKFRIDFLNEELDEYCAAVKEGNLEKQFDALIDLVYVALGTAHLQGLPWQSGWDEVQRANMAKERAKSDGQSKRGTAFDLVKPAGWIPPRLAPLLEDGESQLRLFD